MPVLLSVLLSFLVPQLPTARIEVVVQSAGAPLAGAVATAADQHAVTDSDGIAVLHVPPGRVDVVVTAEGHGAEVARVDVSGGGQARVEVQLSRLAFGESVVVMATRTGTRLEDQPLRVEVIDREEIEEKALMTPGSVAMLLGETTGLRVQTTAPSLGAANVRIQGLRGRYSQVLSDGLPLHGQGDSFTLLQVPPLDLQRVEVIKGATSALYGTSALGGVINLVSRRASAHEHEALFNTTTLGGTDLTIWLAEPGTRGLGWTLLGGFHGQARRDLDDDGWTDVAGYRRGVLRPRLNWDTGAGRSVFVTAGLTGETREGGTLAGAVAPDGHPFTETLDTTRIDTGGLARIVVRGTRVLSVRGSFASQLQDRHFGSARERGRRTTWFAEGSMTGAAGRHTWALGGAWHQDGYDPRELPPHAYRFDTPSLFGQDEVALASWLSGSISGRVDWHSAYGTLASPRVSVLARPANGWTVRASAGAGAFAPTPFTEETDETGLMRLSVLRDLRAERARSASVDLTWSRGRLEFVATVFGSHVRHPIQLREDGEDRVTLVNAERPTRTSGTELIARYRGAGFVATVTHAWTRSTEVDPDTRHWRDVPLTPRHAVSANAMWEGEDWGRVGIEAYYTGRQPLEDNPYRATGRAYLLAGALFERRLGRLRLFVNVENVGNVRQTKDDPLVRPRRAPDGRWTVDAWAPLDGIVANGGLRVSF